MSGEQVYVRATAALAEMHAQLTTTGNASAAPVEAARREIDRACEQMARVVAQCRRELELAQEALEDAWAALSACMQAEDGNCGELRAWVQQCQRAVERAEVRLAQAIFWRAKVERAAQTFRSASHGFLSHLGMCIPAGKNFLNGAIARVEAYEAVAPAVSVASVAGEEIGGIPGVSREAEAPREHDVSPESIVHHDAAEAIERHGGSERGY